MSTQPKQANPQVEAAKRMFSSLSRGRQIALVAGAVGFLASFLPWYGVSINAGAYSASNSITAWHSWGLLAVLFLIVGGVVAALPLLGTSVRALVPSLPPTLTEPRLLIGAGGIAAIATLLFMFTYGSSSSGPGYSAGPSFGAYLGLICAVAIAAGGYLLQKEPAQ